MTIGGAAQTDLAHLAGHAADFHPVADGDGPFGQDDDAADEIVDDVLEAEADADAQRAGDHRQRTQVEPHHDQRHVETQSDDAVAHDPGDGKLQRRLHPRSLQHPVHEKPPQEILRQKDQHQHQNQLPQFQRRQVSLGAGLDQMIIGNLVQQAGGAVGRVVHDRITWFRRDSEAFEACGAR